MSTAAPHHPRRPARVASLLAALAVGAVPVSGCGAGTPPAFEESLSSAQIAGLDRAWTQRISAVVSATGPADDADAEAAKLYEACAAMDQASTFLQAVNATCAPTAVSVKLAALIPSRCAEPTAQCVRALDRAKAANDTLLSALLQLSGSVKTATTNEDCRAEFTTDGARAQAYRDLSAAYDALALGAERRDDEITGLGRRRVKDAQAAIGSRLEVPEQIARVPPGVRDRRPEGLTAGGRGRPGGQQSAGSVRSNGSVVVKLHCGLVPLPVASSSAAPGFTVMVADALAGDALARRGSARRSCSGTCRTCSRGPQALPCLAIVSYFHVVAWAVSVIGGAPNGFHFTTAGSSARQYGQSCTPVWAEYVTWPPAARTLLANLIDWRRTSCSATTPEVQAAKLNGYRNGDGAVAGVHVEARVLELSGELDRVVDRRVGAGRRTPDARVRRADVDREDRRAARRLVVEQAGERDRVAEVARERGRQVHAAVATHREAV
ncbi:MAG: hypothetical protein PGN13_03885, partial [Patulibacter minatonensis]